MKWLARDSSLWVVLFYVGMAVVIAAGLIDNPADYGISPVAFKWIKLLSAVITALAGKAGMSPVPLSRNLEGGKG